VKARDWITLTASVRHGQTVLVLGSEIPDVANSPHGPLGALRLQLAQELTEEKEIVTGTTLAAVAQQYEDAIGAQHLRASAERFYAASSPAPSETYKALAALPFHLILTSCQDDTLAQCLTAQSKRPVVHRYHLRADRRDNPEVEIPRSPEAPLIFHLFGHAAEPASLVLTENDILDFLIAIASERPPLPNSLVHALQRPGQNFLFVGFGIKQWYLRLLLKVLLRALSLDRTGSAIAAEPLGDLSAADREQTVLFYERGTKIEVADSDVGSFVAELTQRVNAAGGYTGRTAVGPSPRVFISYASQDKETAMRLFQALQSAKLQPWLDRERLQPGDLWNRRIEEEIAASDFTIVLQTPALARKIDGYVNKEIGLARDRGTQVRGGLYLIVLSTDDLPEVDRIPELKEIQQGQLRRDHVEEDAAKVASLIMREYQRRRR